MRYDETTCYWCGSPLISGEDIYYSFSIDTRQTSKSFCCESHMKDYMVEAERKGKKVLAIGGVYHYTLKAYQGIGKI